MNNTNNMNIEKATAQKCKQLNKVKKVLKQLLRIISNQKKSSAKKITIESVEIDDNNFNEMLERRQMEQQNLQNEQKQAQQSNEICYVTNEAGSFYWSSNINQFVAVDQDLIDSKSFETSHQTPQIQCC